MTKKTTASHKNAAAPAAQVAASKKAAALKAAAKKQPSWLQQLSRQLPPLTDDVLSAPERLSAAHQSQGPPRLLDKAQVCKIANASYPSIWSWMRAGKFPRSRSVGGRSMWLSTEIEAWMAALPLRRLKGDSDHSEAAE